MSLPQPSTGKGHSPAFRSPFRRRRLIWTIVIVSSALIYLFAPQSFWDTSRAGTDTLKSYVPDKVQNAVEKLPSLPGWGGGKPLYSREEELKDLLHMVASSELVIPQGVDPSKPLDRDVYVVDLGDVAWLQEVKPDPPVIVFSKTYCPYSKKAKKLLDSLDLSPAPKIVEVDLRTDGDSLKTILTRLTYHSTFPNVFIGGQSIGGSDNLLRIVHEGKLQSLLTDAGVSIGSSLDQADAGAEAAGAEGLA